MTLDVGKTYRHKITGRVFAVASISIIENPIEGGVNVRVAVDTCDDDNFRFVVGTSQIERWWPNLTQVHDPREPDAADDYAPRHFHTRKCYDDPGPGDGPPSLICSKIAGVDPDS